MFAPSSRARDHKRWVFGVGVVGLALALTATAVIGPADHRSSVATSVPADDVVVAVVPVIAADERAARVRAADGDVAAAVELARASITLARKTADPRYLGRAQATLSRWWNDPHCPSEILIVRATIRQSLHDFVGARTDLDLILAATPDDGQALLTRAVVATVIGDRAAAARDCERVTAVVDELVGAACAAPLVAAHGAGDAGYQRMATAIANHRRHPAAAWAETARGELARQLGHDDRAELAFRTALAATPDDTYTLGALADLLLDAGRPTEVVSLVTGHPGENLELRLAIALTQTHSAAAAPLVRTIRARIAASIERGDSLHLRERARFLLEVEHDAPAALAAAIANWGIQHEPADARILLEAAKAARKPAAASDLLDWLTAEAIDDAILTRLRLNLAAAP